MRSPCHRCGVGLTVLILACILMLYSSKGYYPFQTAPVVIHGSGYEFGAFGKEEISAVSIYLTNI